MCQMCDEYEAELRRMGIAMDEKITVEFDASDVAALRREAEAHGHDLSTEVRERIRQSLPNPAPDRSEIIEEFRRIRAMTPPGVKQTPARQIIREERDSR